MATTKVKGHEFAAFHAKDSFNRRAVQFKNQIIEILRKIEVHEDQTEIDLDPVAFRKAPASACWYMDGRRLYYSYNGCDKYVENMYVVAKVIEFEVRALLNQKKTVEEFIAEFSEEDDIEEKRKDARKILGLSEDTLDVELIDKKYKELAKELHPDMPTGDLEKFKKVNHAHKTLKRELK